MPGLFYVSFQFYAFSDIQFRRHIQLLRNGRAILFSLADTFCQQILYLAIHRSKVILGPGCDGVIEFSGQTERHLFLGIVCHLVEAAGVDNGLGIPIAAQHYEKIRYHSRLALFVQSYHLFFGEAV